MKKVILIIFLTIGLYATKTDLYFANGIKTTRPDAESNLNRVLVPMLVKYIGDIGQYSAMIHKPKLAYNHTFDLPFVDGGQDLLESLIQKLNFNNIVDWFALTNSGGEKLGKHRRDYLSQIRSYRASLESGFKVITVAHSQGNLFTLEVFQTLQEEGYTDDIYAISVASPSAHPIMIGTPRVDWDNDLVSSLKGIALEHYPNKPLHCIVRYVDWDDINILKSRPKPISHYVYEKNKGTVINGKWQLNEPMYIYEINSQVHAFTFYMGLPLRLDLPKKNSDGTTVTKPILDAYDGSKLIDTKAKEKILDYIKFQLDKNMQDGQGDTNNGSGSSGNGDGGGDNGDSGGGSTIDASNFDINSCGVDIPFGLDIAIKKAIENVDISGKTNEEITKRFCEIIKDLVKNSNKNSGIPKP